MSAWTREYHRELSITFLPVPSRIQTRVLNLHTLIDCSATTAGFIFLLICLKNIALSSGQSGRLHRTDAGDWVWSSDDNDSSDSDDDESPDESPDDNADGVAAATVKKSVSTSPGKLLFRSLSVLLPISAEI